MKATQRIMLFPIGAALLMIGFCLGMQPTSAQAVPVPIRGFLRSLNTRDFFREGQAKLEKNIEQMDKLSQLSSTELLQVDPKVPVQEEKIRELETKPQRQMGIDK